jgi:sigma-B regulation protein RsbU (phosphoserine phosphatase)
VAVAKDIVAASHVQSRLWPGSLPRIAGFECAAASLAARGVGGDFYDVFSIAGDVAAWGLLLGDVSGKGVAAGLVASAVQARVNAAARHARLDAEALMSTVDRDVYATTDGARYATAIYAVLDEASSRLTLVNAGHPPALVVSGPGQVRTLTATGPALGLIEAGEFGSHALRLAPGSVFVAYTDGVSEARNDAGEEFGEARVIHLVESTRQDGASRICSAILDAVRAHRGSQQDQDDVTVMVVQRTGEAAS